MITIGVIDANSQEIEATLDDELFYLMLDWNDSSKSWTLAVRNSTYEIVITGIALVPHYSLTWQFRYSEMPKGELLVETLKDRNGPIPRDGFSSGLYELVYITVDDMAEAGIDWH